MTKQEEIKEGIAFILGAGLKARKTSDQILSHLHSQGVVIKAGYTVRYSVSIPAGTELTAVEPLIEEIKE